MRVTQWGALTNCSIDTQQMKITMEFTDLWKLKVPSKVSLFAWRLVRDRLPTKVNLRRRNMELNDVCCPLCRNYDEDASHLFFSCVKPCHYGGKHSTG